jgi:hypothetical protein
MAEQQSDLQMLLREIRKDPEAARLLNESIKKVKPALALPEVEAEERVLSKLQAKYDEQQKKLQELTEQLQRERLTEKYERERSEAKARYNLTDEELKAAEQLIADGKVGELSVAADYIHLQKQPLTPAGFGIQAPPVRDEERDWREQIKDPASDLRKNAKQHFRKQIPALLEEIGPLARS